jgi:type IV pilus modification protein PilV
MRTRKTQRGVSMIEVTISLSVMAIGLLGMAHMQVIAVRSNALSRNTAFASALARDLTEAIGMWSYEDARLTPLATVASFTDSQVADRINIGKSELFNTSLRAQYSEQASDANATVNDALGPNYDGVRSDEKDLAAGAEGGTKLHYKRYWTVFAYDPEADGVKNGKFIVIVVRWKEPGFGMRQVVHTTFKANTQVFAL